MTYYTNLFSPETYEVFANSARDISGFRLSQMKTARKLHTGDLLICYMTKLSRWVGLLEVVDGPFQDDTPIFYEQDDPFVVRFRVRTIVWLPVDEAIPIHEPELWDNLSFTRALPGNSTKWTGKIRRSLTVIEDVDGRVLEKSLRAQYESGAQYPMDQDAYKKLVTHRVRRANKKDIVVTIPEEDDDDGNSENVEVRESIEIQALLAEIGSRMGLSIWVPKSDRGRVLAQWESNHSQIIDRLPLNYDETTLQTIEQIDVLWLSGRAIRRAFEVEHTTSIYSGLLRMADLLALQPNMDIHLHIVAPEARRDKVKREIQRPVFSLLERPLSECCTYIAYGAVRELVELPHLPHLSDAVLEDYEEQADEL